MPVAFPAVAPAALVQLADRLEAVREAVYGAVVDVDRAVIAVDGRWTGAAASAYLASTNRLAADAALAGETVGVAAPVLRAYAAAIERARDQHRAGVELEARARAQLPASEAAVAAAQWAQVAAVDEHRGHSEVCRQRLEAVATALREIAGPSTADVFSLPFTPTFDLFDEWMDRLAASGGTVDGVPIHLVPPGAVLPQPGQVDSDDMPLGTGTDLRWRLPASGTGFVVYNPDDSPLGRNAPAELRRRLGPGEIHDQVGTYTTIRRMQSLAEQWSRTHPDRLVQYGDISLQGGVDTADHGTHQDGRTFDMRPLRRDGRLENLTYRDTSEYDRELTKEYIRMVRREYPGARVIFNDPRIAGDPEFRGYVTRDGSGVHDDHLHVTLPDD